MTGPELLTALGGLPGLVLLVLAVYRLSRLLVRESGPWAVLEQYRAIGIRAGLEGLVTCIYCTSVWVAALLTLFWLSGLPGQAVVLVLAASAGACMIDELV